MRRRTWKEYNQNLVKRGRITFLIDSKLLKGEKKKRLGRPRLFSHPLIQLLLILKIQFHLSYRALEGFAKEILPHYIDVKLPSYSVICRRAAELEKGLPKLSNKKPSVILLDASGLKIYGEGEWKVKVHGKSKRRKWVKIHIGVDEKSQEIVGVAVTGSHVADCSAGVGLIDRCPKSAKVYLADGGYDTKECREKIHQRGARALIPPRQNAIPGKDMVRNQSLYERKALGHDKEGLSLWGKLTGYSKRALVETSFSRLKRLYGGGLYSREGKRQSVEIYLKCLMMNKMISLSG